MIKKLIPLLLVVNTISSVCAQNNAENAIATFSEKYPQEKIHIVLNKNSYIAGENIWFKSFVFDGYSPSQVSTTLFAELYDHNKTLIAKKFLPLINGEGNGSFTLPENLKEDVYYIRAYTTWMSNFSEEFQPLKPITIYNPSSNEKLTKAVDTPWSASVFPESGTFIEGIPTKFAVRLQSEGQTPGDWSGYVIDTKKPDVKITSFKGFDQNVGLFTLTPDAGAAYQLVVTDSKGKQQTVVLPEPKNSGFNLQVAVTNEAIKFKLKSKNIGPSTAYKVIGTLGNEMVFKVNSDKILEHSFSIPTKESMNGILQLTVFDDKENIVAQRLCFVKPDVLNVKKSVMQPVSLQESPKALNTFNVSSAGFTAYTVLVMDGISESSEDENSLLSTLWLTGDLTSKIYTPSQYFKENHNSEALDALLISEKWKRFDWKNIIAGSYPTIRYQPQPYVTYKGKVSINGKPAVSSDLNLLFEMPDHATRFHQVKTDANGFFSLNGLIFEDNIKVSYQLNDLKIPKEQVQVIFQPDYTFVPYRKSLPSDGYMLEKRISGEPLPPQVTRYVAEKQTQSSINEKVTLIEEVKLKVKKKDKTRLLNEKLSTSMFRSSDEQVFDFVNDNTTLGFANILMWLQGKVAGLAITTNMGNYNVKLRGYEIPIYLDEMQLDPSMISSISSSDVAMIKVIKGFFSAGFGGGYGAIAIYTKRGGMTGYVPDNSSPKLNKYTLNGFDKVAPFATPSYNDESFKSISNDVRSVLYWNPYLLTDPETPANVQFYNNNDAKNYKIIIMGYDNKENLPVYYNALVQ